MNMMCSSHKATNEKFRKGYDRIFKKERVIVGKIFPFSPFPANASGSGIKFDPVNFGVISIRGKK